MSQIRITRVKIQGFRSFRDLQDSGELPANGIGLIRGVNKDTGGSSGAGKSTFALAVAYAFGYCPYPATKLQCWLPGSPKLQVEVHFEGPQGVGVLWRGERVALEINGVLKEGPGPVDTALKDFLGLDTALLEALCYRRQKAPGLFLSMTDADKKQFLGQLLGLEEIETKIESAQQSINKLDGSLLKAQEQERLYQEQLASLPALDFEFEDLEGYKLKIKELERAVGVVQQEKLVQEGLVANRQKEYEKTQCLVADARADQESVLSIKQQSELVEFGKTRPQVDGRTEKLRVLLSDCSNRLLKAREDESERRTLMLEEIHGLQDRISGIKRVDLKKLAADIVNLEKKIVNLQASVCPTCEQSWTNDAAKAKLNALSVEYVSAVGIEGQAIEYTSSLPEWEAKLKTEIERHDRYANPAVAMLQTARDKVFGELAEAQASTQSAEKLWKANLAAKQAEFASELSQLRESFAQSKELVVLEQQLQKEHNALNEIKMFVNNAVLAVDSARREMSGAGARNNVVAANKREYDFKASDLSKKLEAAVKQRRSVEQDIHSERDFVGLLKEFLASIFDEVLREIAQEANEHLKSLPNVATTTISFDSEYLTQKGVAKKKIVAVVNKGGVEIPLEAGLSGGQLTSVELAVDLALGTVIGRRTGRSPGWLVLDESFEGHDLPVKEACLGVLTRAAKDRLILVVDHATEVKELFGFFLDIESMGDVSVIQPRIGE